MRNGFFISIDMAAFNSYVLYETNDPVSIEFSYSLGETNVPGI